jgi:hypothetical protein
MTTPTMANLATAWINGKHTCPTMSERKDFMVWLLRESKRMEAEDIRPVFVTREVSFNEAMMALNRPTLPGEVKWFPVSRLHNEPNLDLMSQTQNLMFRAVHDWTHWKIKADATFEGEYAVTLAHLNSAPESIRWILFSEVACQAAVAISQGEFPTQKLVKIE